MKKPHFKIKTMQPLRKYTIIMHWLFKFKVQIMACQKAERLHLLNLLISVKSHQKNPELGQRTMKKPHFKMKTMQPLRKYMIIMQLLFKFQVQIKASCKLSSTCLVRKLRVNLQLNQQLFLLFDNCLQSRKNIFSFILINPS